MQKEIENAWRNEKRRQIMKKVAKERRVCVVQVRMWIMYVW